jgi:protein-disulfide isomerase
MATTAALTARRPRRRRLWQLCGVIALVAVGVAVLVATSPSATRATLPIRGPHGDVALVDATLGAIPQHANMLGSPNAPVTLEYFGDLECPYCREFTVYALPAIIGRWVRTGRLRIIYRSMETATADPRVWELQQVAALAAGHQNKMWYFIELFYHEQHLENSGYVTERYLQGLAQQVPRLNLPQWETDRNDPALAAAVRADESTAKKVRIPGTPGLFFGRTGGGLTLYRAPSLSRPAGFDRVIEGLLQA